MKIQPLKNNLAVVRIKTKAQTESGIILTSAATIEIDKAQIVAIGPDVVGLAIDDLVLVDWNKAKGTTLDGIPTYVLNEDDVQGKIVG